LAFLLVKGKQFMFTSHGAPKQVDSAAVWNQSKKILFAVARKVKLAIRLKLNGHGRGEAEPEELVNDAFITLMEALPRFNPKTAKFTTFVYGLARRRMWLVARAAFYGLSPEQMHRMDAAKRTPRFHYDVNSRRRRGFRQPEPDTEERESVRRVQELRRQQPREYRRLIDLWIEEGGNVSSLARRLRRDRSALQGRYTRLFRVLSASV
jgi:RNA polymerase sigma factor (sigma-70 family)